MLVSIIILSWAIFLESSIQGFSFCCGYIPFTVLQHLVEPFEIKLWQWATQFTFNLLHYGFLTVSLVAISKTNSRRFAASSVHPTNLRPSSPVRVPFFVYWISSPWLFLWYGVQFRTKKVCYIYFSCAHATVFDLKITSEFQIKHNTSVHLRYWLSSKGKP